MDKHAKRSSLLHYPVLIVFTLFFVGLFGRFFLNHFCSFVLVIPLFAFRNGNKSLELGFHCQGRSAGLQRQGAFQNHFFDFDFSGREPFKFVGERVPADIAGENTKQGGDKRRGNGMSQLVDVREVSQRGNQADNGAENA